MNPPMVVPGFPYIQPGMPSGAPGNAPMSTPSMTASGIPLGCSSCTRYAYDGSPGVMGPSLRDISPPSWPLWAKMLLIGGFVAAPLLLLRFFK